MPRSDKYIRIDKTKLYHVLALMMVRGGASAEIIKNRIEVYADLLDVKVDYELLMIEIQHLKNGINGNGGK